MTIPENKLAYSVESFAREAELSVSFVKQEIYRGNLHAVKRRGRVLIPVESARAYVMGEQKEKAQDQVETSKETA